MSEQTRSTHTPGPWFVSQTNHGSNRTQVWARGGDVRVANCDSAAVSLEGRRADARLIAAAPEMFEALRLYLEWCEAEDDHTKADFYQRIEMCRATDAAARAAIAKATGDERALEGK